MNKPMESNRAKRSIMVPLLMALVLCLSAYIQLAVATRSDFVNPLAADSGRYFSYVYNVEHFGIYSSQVVWDPGHDEGLIAPDKTRTPGYPLFLMLLPTAEPTMAFVRQIFLWQAMLGVLTESLFTTAQMAATLAPVRAFKTQRRSWAIAGGLL